MFDIMSFALGLVLGVIGMVIEGYCTLAAHNKNKKMYESQIRRREEMLAIKEKHLSNLNVEVDSLRKRNERLRMELERKSGVNR